MGWRTLLAVGGVGLVVAACGGAPAAPPTAETSVTPSPVPTVARAVASPVAAPSPSPRPTASAEAAKIDTVYVANTDGQGVFVRKTPLMADRVRAYPDGTPLTLVGDDVDGDGQHWHHVKTPDDVDGYVPATYTVDTPP